MGSLLGRKLSLIVGKKLIHRRVMLCLHKPRLNVKSLLHGFKCFPIIVFHAEIEWYATYIKRFFKKNVYSLSKGNAKPTIEKLQSSFLLRFNSHTEVGCLCCF